MRRSLSPLIASVRPEQWSKNLLLFAGLMFGGRLLDPASVVQATAAFAIFCGLSSAVYLFNDISDHDADRNHPVKRFRPVASGELPVRAAATAAVIFGAGALGAAVVVGQAFAAIAAAYLTLLLLYSTWLKHIVIIDVLSIAAGFVLRAIAGAVVVGVPVGPWLPVCTTLLALFLVLSKRRHELTVLGEGATSHRPILEEYSPYLLDQMIAVVTASTVIAYSVFATSTETAQRLGTANMGLTIPFVLYGIFRYLYLVHRKRGGGNPTTTLVTDGPLLACVALWAIAVALCLYVPLGR